MSKPLSDDNGFLFSIAVGLLVSLILAMVLWQT